MSFPRRTLSSLSIALVWVFLVVGVALWTQPWKPLDPYAKCMKERDAIAQDGSRLAIRECGVTRHPTNQ